MVNIDPIMALYLTTQSWKDLYMSKIKIVCLASFLAASIAQASTPCDGFEIKIKNALPDSLVATNTQLSGATIQPAGIQKIDGNSEAVFTVNGSAENLPMSGYFTFRTISLPSKVVRIRFNLTNQVLVCEHSEDTSDGDYPISHTRLPGKITYTIGN